MTADPTPVMDAAGVTETPSPCHTSGFGRWVRPYFGRYRKQMALALALGLATFACSALLMYTAGFLISFTADPALPTLAAIMYAVGFVQIFGIGRPVARYAERLASHDWVFRMTSSLRVRLFGILEAHAMQVRRNHQLGDFLGLVVDDIGHVQNLFLRTLFPIAIAGVLWVATALFFGVFDARFALAVLAATGIAVVALPLIARKVNGARIRQRKQLRGELYAQLADDVLGAADWVFSSRGVSCLARHTESQRAERQVQRRIDRFDHACDLLQAAVFGTTAVAVTLWAGAHFASGHVGGTSNWIAAFALGFFPLVEAFGPVASAAADAENHAQTLERLNDLPTQGDADCDGEAAGNPVPDAENESQPTAAAKAAQQCGGQRAATFEQRGWIGDAPTSTLATEPATHRTSQADSFAGADIPNSTTSEGANSSDGTASEGESLSQAASMHLQDVTFAYPDAAHPALDGVSLHIPAGQKVAVLGRSGAGKSTLAQVARGDLSPQAGTVLVGGQTPEAISPRMHEHIGLVQQQTYLFNRTLRENLSLARADATDDDIWAALRMVEMEDVAKRLPQGLDTVLDEAGAQFSGGERHRLAFARVLLARTPIVLLDEPMVGLDPATERALLDTLFQVCAEKTLVMITHHLQDVQRFDRVVFVEDGRIALDGSPAQLAETSDRYRALLALDQLQP